jgi:hypothetical protein
VISDDGSSDRVLISMALPHSTPAAADRVAARGRA